MADGEEKVLATAQHIVKSLHHTSTDGSADDIILLFSTIDPRFANLSNLMSNPSTPTGGGSGGAAAAVGGSPSCDSTPSVVVNGGGGDGEEEDDDSSNSSNNQSSLNLDEAEDRINRWEAGTGIDDYLDVVDHIIGLTEQLELGDDADRAETTLQLAMSRLEEEFTHTLALNTIPLDPVRIDGVLNKRRSFLSISMSSAGDSDAVSTPDFESVSSFDEGSSGRYHRRRVTGSSLGGDELFHDLVNPDAIDELRAIAGRMIRAGYEKECCQAYSGVRRDVLDECMAIIGVEKLSIEEVQRMDWKLLNEKIKQWIRSLKIVVRILLTGENRLCVDIFPDSDMVADVCFVEATKGCVMQIMNFGEAVAIGRRSVEKLSRILDMFDALSGVLPDLEELYKDKEAGDMLYTEAKGVLDGLREAAIGTFDEFENAVQGETSRAAIPNGEIHPLTRYVMNYVRLLADYRPILNILFENGEEPKPEQGTDSSESETTSPTAQRMLSLIKSLEKNLEEKARMYEDGGLQFVFLMNNILYIVQKVKGSELGNLLGDNWIRRHRGQIRQYSTSYLRASWTRALSFLKDEGIGAITNTASKVILKERFKSFNACFEDIYRIQSAWKVPDMQLRDELKISISEKVIPAYRSFLGRFGSHLESGKHAGKYIKYTSEDLDYYVSHLFEGTPLVLHHVRRKSG